MSPREPRTLAVALDWIPAHCVVPDRFARGDPFALYDFQFRYLANFYLVKPDARWVPDDPVLGSAFAYRRGLLVDPQKKGKALALDTPVPTPAGWTTMGEVAPGDQVFDERGRPCSVVAKSPVWRDTDCYRVTFSDGAEFVASGDHLWRVERRTPGTTYMPDVIATRGLVGELVDNGGARRFRVRNAEPLQTPDVSLPVDPYVLGAWLGDGEAGTGRITSADHEVTDEIELAGYRVRHDVRYRWVVYGLRMDLRRAGVLNRKHIPSAYLRASEKQRWALLQGLMDTDGYVDVRGKCEFTTTSCALRDGVGELLYSLGIKHRVVAGKATLYGRVTGPKWRLQFAARADTPLFRIARKLSRMLPAGRSHAQYGHRRIVAVDRVPSVETVCIEVDSPARVFLVGRQMVPTHNSPLTAAHICLEGVGPALFAGWAVGGERYDCRDFGCGCGWVYPYEPGEPMGMPWATPLIQITALSEENTDNIYDSLRPMIEHGPLREVIPKTGEEFIRLPGGGRIDVVTQSAKSRLGQRVTFVPQDEVGLWTKANKMTVVADTQYRGLAGMGGRASLNTNAWDPSEESLGQREFESAAKDIYRQFVQPPAHLSYLNKRERRQIHRFVYGEALRDRGGHVDLDSIEAEAADMASRDPAQAERFFGNRVVYGAGGFLDGDKWDDRAFPLVVPDGSPIVLGMDGSDTDDWTAIRAETEDGFQFTPTFGPDHRPTFWDPAEFGGQVPRLEVAAAVNELMNRFQVARMYVDPPDWKSEVDDWAAEFGDKRVLRWETYRPLQMHAAAQRLYTDVMKADTPFWHDGCPVTARHVRHARKSPRPGQRYVLAKPNRSQKIDACVTSILVHEAACDVTAADLWPKLAPRRKLVVMR